MYFYGNRSKFEAQGCGVENKGPGIKVEARAWPGQLFLWALQPLHVCADLPSKNSVRRLVCSAWLRRVGQEVLSIR